MGNSCLDDRDCIMRPVDMRSIYDICNAEMSVLDFRRDSSNRLKRKRVSCSLVKSPLILAKLPAHGIRGRNSFDP
jgi:hypothetical protein